MIGCVEKPLIERLNPHGESANQSFKLSQISRTVHRSGECTRAFKLTVA